ncbi:hypothetical protein CI102_14677 [Trichoderma harzianum]|nr:hypothetical protein CI102_14677 [Trichoderma harzianum]
MQIGSKGIKKGLRCYYSGYKETAKYYILIISLLLLAAVGISFFKGLFLKYTARYRRYSSRENKYIDNYLEDNIIYLSTRIFSRRPKLLSAEELLKLVMEEIENSSPEGTS